MAARPSCSSCRPKELKLTMPPTQSLEQYLGKRSTPFNRPSPHLTPLIPAFGYSVLRASFPGASSQMRQLARHLAGPEGHQLLGWIVRPSRSGSPNTKTASEPDF